MVVAKLGVMGRSKRSPLITAELSGTFGRSAVGAAIIMAVASGAKRMTMAEIMALRSTKKWVRSCAAWNHVKLRTCLMV